VIFVTRKKIGIIIDSYQLSSWKISSLTQILQNPNLELGGILYFPKVQSQSISIQERILFKIESKRKISGKSAIDKMDLDKFLKNHSEIPIKEFLGFNSEEKIKIKNFIDELELDLLIYFGEQDSFRFTDFEPEIWYFSFAPDYISTLQFIGAKSTYSKNLSIHSVLYSISKFGFFKIFDIYSPTDSLSVKRMSNNHFWTCYSRLLKALQNYSLCSVDDFHQRLKKINQDEKTKKIKLNFSKIFISLFKKKYLNDSKSSNEQWSLLYSLEKKLSFDFKNFKVLSPTQDRFWADPFVIYQDGRYFVFFEEFMYDKKKGHISFVEMDVNGCYSKPKKILEKSYHLSYPHIFKYDSSIFMIPDSVENKSVDLYKCEDFPNKWKFVKTLLHGEFIDSDILFHNEKCWIISGEKSENLPYVDTAIIHYSGSLFDDFTPHFKNPVISNYNWARNAGKIFAMDNKLIHPTQSYSRGYGSGINLNEITQLSASEFTIKEIKKLEPDWDNSYSGMHTINHSEGLTIIDVKKA